MDLGSHIFENNPKKPLINGKGERSNFIHRTNVCSIFLTDTLFHPLLPLFTATFMTQVFSPNPCLFNLIDPHNL